MIHSCHPGTREIIARGLGVRRQSVLMRSFLKITKRQNKTNKQSALLQLNEWDHKVVFVTCQTWRDIGENCFGCSCFWRWWLVVVVEAVVGVCIHVLCE